MSESPKISDPDSWSFGVWAVVVSFSILFAFAQTVTYDKDWGSRGHQVFIGIALVELAVLFHLMIYPDVLIVAVRSITAALATLWSLLPTIPWEPWHVTTSMGGLVGPLFILNGLRAGGAE